MWRADNTSLAVYTIRLLVTQSVRPTDLRQVSIRRQDVHGFVFADGWKR
jgi:hypothetical protein